MTPKLIGLAARVIGYSDERNKPRKGRSLTTLGLTATFHGLVAHPG